MANRGLSTKSASQVRREAERKMETAIKAYAKAALHEGIAPEQIVESVRELAYDAANFGEG
jgi:hypothetical protein